MKTRFASDFEVQTPESVARGLGIEIGRTIAATVFATLAVTKGSVPDADEFLEEVTTTEAEHYRQFYSFKSTAFQFNRAPDPEAVWEAYEDGVATGARNHWDAMVRPDLEVCGKGRRGDCLAGCRYGPTECFWSRHTFDGTWKCGLSDEDYEKRMIKRQPLFKDGGI